MAQENVDIMLRGVEAWNSGGVEAVLRLNTEDVVWYPFPDAPASSGGLHGHDGIREVMAGWTDSFEDFKVTTHECREVGGVVLWLGEISGTIKGSGVPASQPMGSVSWDFRDGKMSKARFFPSWDEAVRAAGADQSV